MTKEIGEIETGKLKIADEMAENGRRKRENRSAGMRKAVTWQPGNGFSRCERRLAAVRLTAFRHIKDGKLRKWKHPTQVNKFVNSCVTSRYTNRRKTAFFTPKDASAHADGILRALNIT